VKTSFFETFAVSEYGQGGRLDLGEARLKVLSWGKAWKKLNVVGIGEIIVQGQEMNLQYEHASLCRCLRSNDSNRNVQFQAEGAMTTCRRSLEGGKTWRLARKAPSLIIVADSETKQRPKRHSSIQLLSIKLKHI
jgi:hypothetical protein